jgi:hypothetical protein
LIHFRWICHRVGLRDVDLAVGERLCTEATRTVPSRTADATRWRVRVAHRRRPPSRVSERRMGQGACQTRLVETGRIPRKQEPLIVQSDSAVRDLFHGGAEHQEAGAQLEVLVAGCGPDLTLAL